MVIAASTLRAVFRARSSLWRQDHEWAAGVKHEVGTEKFLYITTVIALSAHGQLPSGQAAMIAVPDGTLGLFVVAFVRTAVTPTAISFHGTYAQNIDVRRRASSSVSSGGVRLASTDERADAGRSTT